MIIIGAGRTATGVGCAARVNNVLLPGWQLRQPARAPLGTGRSGTDKQGLMLSA